MNRKHVSVAGFTFQVGNVPGEKGVRHVKEYV